MANPWTPGPWIVDPNLKHYPEAATIVWGARGPGYGEVARADAARTTAASNARLISSAPDLAEAAQDALVMLSDLMDRIDEHHHPGDAALLTVSEQTRAKLRYALEKAGAL